MVGPAYGHNILPFLEYFNDSNHELTLLYSGKNTFANAFSKVCFVQRNRSKLISQYLKIFRTQEYDLIWYHGGYSYLDVALIILLKRKSLKINLNLWGEAVPKNALKNSVKGMIHRWIFRKAEFVQCNWISTYNLINKIKCPGVFLNPWGLSEGFFTDTQSDVSAETKKFIQSLPATEFKIFWPKSILPVVRHDLIIEAAKLLREEDIKNYKIYFWLGSINDKELLEKHKSLVNQYGLSENIIFVDHEFVPFTDMKQIWGYMDAGINFVDNDQLSAAVLEPLVYGKETILCDIEPYEYLNKQMKLGLDLVPFNSHNIASVLKQYISGEQTSHMLKQERKLIIQNNFRFYDNITKVLRHVGL